MLNSYNCQQAVDMNIFSPYIIGNPIFCVIGMLTFGRLRKY